MSTYKISKNGIDYSFSLQEGFIPYAVNLGHNGNPSKFIVIATKPNVKSTFTFGDRCGLIREHPNESPVKRTLIEFFPGKEHDLATIRLASKHRSKNWCLVLIEDNLEGWFETELIRADA